MNKYRVLENLNIDIKYNNTCTPISVTVITVN